MDNLARGILLGALCAVACVSLARGEPVSNNPRLWLERFPQPLSSDYLSPVQNVAAGFSSAVVSWNAQVPAGAWLDVQLRARLGDRWSAWYDMGHWSTDYTSGNRRSVAKQADPDGRIDTDTLFLNHAANALQVQVLFHPGPQGAKPSLSLLAVTTDTAAAAPSANQAWGDDIDVPQRTQHVAGPPSKLGGGGEAWCSPTSVSMLLGYWSALLRHPEWDADVPASAAGTYDPVYDGCGNWPFNIAYATEHGLQGWVERLGSLRDVERYIQAGVPVIASIKVAAGEMDGTPYRSTDGHLLVIRGFTAGGDVIVNDPAGRPGAIRRVYRRDQFEHAWQHGSGGIVYIIGPPALLQTLR